MIKAILYSDCDGVIFDTIDTAFQIMRENGVNMNDKRAIDSYFRHELDWEDVFRKADIINNAVEKLKMLKESHLFSDVAILTRLCGNHKEEVIKKALFGEILPNMKLITVDFHLSKTDIVAAENNILVDDEMKNITPWQRENGKAILFIKNAVDLENDIINDLLDIPNTKSVKKLLKIK